MRKIFGAILCLLGVWMFMPTAMHGQATNAAPASAATNAPAATPPAAVPLGNVVAAIGEDSNKLQEIQAQIASDHTVAEVDQSLAGLTPEIGRRKGEDDKLLEARPSLSTLRTTQIAWQMLADSLATPKQVLATRISQLDTNETQLGEMTQKWQATLASAKSSGAPPEILGRINSFLGTIGETGKAVAALRAQILSSQNRLAVQDARIAGELKSIQKAQDSAVNLLFVRDSAPLWNLGGEPATAAKPENAAANLFAPQVVELRTYVAGKFPTAILHLGIFIAFAFVLFWVRRKVTARTKDDPAVEHSAQVFHVPIAMAAVLALLVSGWFYPLAPRLFRAGLGAAALIPAVIILRRLIEPSLFPILYAMVGAYFVDQLRYVVAVQPIFGRLLFQAEIIGAILFLVWLLRSHRLAQAAENMLERLVRAYAWFALAIFGLATLADVLGYTHLSYLMGNAMLGSSYLAVILYAAVRIADGLILAALKIRPFSLLGMVRRHYLRMAGNASRAFRWAAFLYWIWETLDLFSLRAPIWNGGRSIFTYTIPYGSLDLSLWPVVLFALTIWVTLLISRFIRFVLEEEVYPNFKLGPGVPYATSTMVHYAVLVLGTLFALTAVKIDLSKYSVLAGAIGVGLGFGLQNIMNNFVSGIILLFERPIKVGDVIQVDTALGTVESIGIRASVIRITNGSEVIMPNGNLISNQVTNWTFSDRRRVIEVPVAVAAKSDPARVMALLVETAKAHPLVLGDPAPQVLFTNFSGATLNFELRAWTNGHESWAQIRSDLALAISSALTRENIAMS